jgi:hypothetical protein
MKNSRSNGNASYMTQPSPLPMPLPKPNTRLHRSESSPSMNPQRFPGHPERRRGPNIVPALNVPGCLPHCDRAQSPPMAPTVNNVQRYLGHRNRTPSPDVVSYYAEVEDFSGSSTDRRGRQQANNDSAHIGHRERIYQSRFRARKMPETYSPSRGRHLASSPTKALDDVFEREEAGASLESKTNNPFLQCLYIIGSIKKAFFGHCRFC